MIDSSTIDQIREATDLVTLIGETVELKPAGKELRGICPFHDDHNPSFCVHPEKQRWFCHPCNKGGDAIAFLRERDSVGFPDAVRDLARRAGVRLDCESSVRGPIGRVGVTVAEWVRAKRLDAGVVRALNITDIIWRGAPAISFPYYESELDRVPRAIHIRRTLGKVSDVPRFEWQKGDRPIPYGLWLLSTSVVHERGFIVLVEGESDFISLLENNIPALGVPGNSWRESWSQYLTGITRVVVSIEPDDGGKRMVESLTRSSIWSRCELIPIGAVAEGVAV